MLTPRTDQTGTNSAKHSRRNDQATRITHRLHNTPQRRRRNTQNCRRYALARRHRHRATARDVAALDIHHTTRPQTGRAEGRRQHTTGHNNAEKTIESIRAHEARTRTSKQMENGTDHDNDTATTRHRHRQQQPHFARADALAKHSNSNSNGTPSGSLREPLREHGTGRGLRPHPATTTTTTGGGTTTKKNSVITSQDSELATRRKARSGSPTLRHCAARPTAPM